MCNHLLDRLTKSENDPVDCRRVRPPPSKSILDIILDCLWWWGSSFGDLESVEYFFIAITPRSTFTWFGSTCWSPIYRSNRTVQSFTYDYYYYEYLINRITQQHWNLLTIRLIFDRIISKHKNGLLISIPLHHMRRPIYFTKPSLAQNLICGTQWIMWRQIKIKRSPDEQPFKSVWELVHLNIVITKRGVFFFF